LGQSLALRDAATPIVETVQWRGGFGWRGGLGWRGGFGGLGLGLATGALIGAAITSPYVGYGYGYPSYGYPYSYAPTYYAPAYYGGGYLPRYTYWGGYAPRYQYGFGVGRAVIGGARVVHYRRR